MIRLLKSFALVAAMGLVLPQMSVAAGYQTVDWADLKQQVYGDREILPAEGAIVLDAPGRATDDRRVPVSIRAQMTDGSMIRSVSLIIDENPMPVAAVFDFNNPQFAVRLGADLRLNGPSPVRAVVETEDGRLYMTDTVIKTSGLGACAAPPIGNPEEAIASIGQMEAEALDIAHASSAPRAVKLNMKHPQHTGMQMDQITLLYILPRYVHKVDVWSGDTQLFTMTGSISLSEDPSITFDLPDPDARQVRVRLEDTDETVIDRVLPLFPET